jgi:hypothetical protein
MRMDWLRTRILHWLDIPTLAQVRALTVTAQRAAAQSLDCAKAAADLVENGPSNRVTGGPGTGAGRWLEEDLGHPPYPR